MRILLFLLSFLDLNCQQPVQKHPEDQEMQKDSVLRITQIFSSNSARNTSLIVKHDSAFFVLPRQATSSQDCLIYTLSYGSTHGQFEYYKYAQADDCRKSSDSIAHAGEVQINIQSIGEPHIQYVKLDKKNLSNDAQAILKRDTKIFSFGKEYYFIDSLMPKSIYVLNPSNGSLNSFDINGEFFQVTDFFLSDIDNDGHPEIFIFNIGKVSRDEVISYTVYSIRRDSVKTDYRF